MRIIATLKPFSILFLFVLLIVRPVSAQDGENLCSSLFDNEITLDNLRAGLTRYSTLITPRETKPFVDVVFKKWISFPRGDRRKFLDFIKDNYTAAVKIKNNEKKYDLSLALSNEILSFKRTADAILSYELAREFRPIVSQHSEGIQLFRFIYDLNRRAVGIEETIDFNSVIEIAREFQRGLNYISRYSVLPEDVKIVLSGSVASGRGIRGESDLDYYAPETLPDILFENLRTWIEQKISTEYLQTAGIKELSPQRYTESYASTAIEVFRNKIRVQVRMPTLARGTVNFDNFVYLEISD